MPKHKGVHYTSSFSYLLEEPIDVPYRILGHPEWLEQKIPSHLKSIQTEIRPGREELDLVPVLADLFEHENLGVDSESGGPKERDGLDPISSTSETLLFQVGHVGMIYVVDPALVTYFREPLESTEHLKIGQNLEHDFKWLLKKHDTHLVRLYCTMLSEQVLRAGLDGFGVSLLDLVRHHAFRLISKEVRAQFINHSGAFTEEQLYYAARDVFLLFDIFTSQEAELKQHKLITVAKDEFNCLPATAEMELTGVYIDRRYLDLSIGYYARQQVTLQREIMEIFNEELRKLGKKKQSEDFFTSLFAESDEEVFNLDSAEQKIAALEKIGLTLENAQRGTLKKIKNRLTDKMVEYSIVQKIVSTYGQRLVDMIHPDDGRLHPVFKQLGQGDASSQGNRDNKETTATGRFSSDFQQLLRPREIYELVTDVDEISAVNRVMARQIASARAEWAEIKAKEEKEKVA